MIQGMLAKKAIEIVIKQIMKKSEIRKLRKYVEEDNELDIKVKKLESKLKKLEKLAHPQADFICCECGCKAKRKTNKRRK